MANRLSSVQSLFPVMRPALVLLWCDEDRKTRRTNCIKPGSLMWCKVVCWPSSRWVHFRFLQLTLWTDEKQLFPTLLRDLYPHNKSSSFPKWKHFFIIIYSWLWSNPLIISIPSLDISLSHPKHHQTAIVMAYCASLNILAYTCPPPALTLSHQVWIW